MKPTAHIAKPVATPKTGRFALLRGPHRAPGSGAPARGLAADPFMARSLVVLCALAGLFALSTAGVAQAEPPKLISYGQFKTATTFPLGIAVDNSGDASAADVYVTGFFNEHGEPPIDKFDASGKLLSTPSPFGEVFGLGLSAAVNPTNGNLDVFETSGFMQAYNSSTGSPVAPPESFPVESSGNAFGGILPQIATDSVGDVYVPDPVKETSPGSEKYEPNDEIHEYSPSGALLATFTDNGTLKEPTGVTVDSAGNLWVADRANSRIVELNSSGAPVEVDGKPVEIKSEGVQTIALDGHGDVFAIVKNETDFCGSLASPCSHLVEYDAAGAQVADVGAGTFEAGGSRFPPMVAVDEDSGRVYATDGAKEEVLIFGPPKPPVVEKELTAEVTTSEAKLGALVNSGGIQTTYRFEYGTSTGYGQSTPFPEGSVGEGLASHAVWAAASGLAPGMTYHYRVVATSELGEAVGPDQTFTTLSAEQAACPNEEFRGGFSARLPDCRAYELVTPPSKASVTVTGAGPAAGDGDAIGFDTKEPLPEEPTGGLHYIATRGASGWSAEDIIPLESYSGATCDSSSNDVVGYSDGLSTALISFGRDSRASEPGGSELEKQECNAEGLQVVPGEPVGYQNLLLRENATGAYRLLNAPPPSVTPADAHFQGASADLSHVVFSEMAPLVEGAPYGVEDLYEWDEGALRLLSAGGSLAGTSNGSSAGAISADGSHILFESGGDLYVRIDGEEMVQVDKSQGPGASGGGSFQAASADGSEVFFLDESKLTSESTAESGKPDLYECVLPEGASGCELTDLTVAKGGEPADVLRVSLLGNQDSSHVYFVAKGVLAANKRQYTDSEGKEVEEGAVNGERNLYVWDDGTITYIATFGEDDFLAGYASPDGAWFAFDSSKGLTGYDNTPSVGPEPEPVPVQEIFLYSAASQQLLCASCNPSGEVPLGGGGADLGSFARRPLSDGGRLFFETKEALLPADTNGQVDVYEYEDGHVYPISTGTSPRASTFKGASESGGNVFFQSSQQLVPQDTQPEASVIYDARVEGGFPEPASPPPCTNADACRAPVSPQPSVYGAPASATFSGAGNLTPPEVKPKAKPKPKSKSVKCKKGFVKKKGRCVKRPRNAGKSAHANERTGK